MTWSKRGRGAVPAGADLRDALEVALSASFGYPRHVARLERRPSPYQTSFALEELVVHLEDGTVLPLIFKNVSREALIGSARQAKPAFLFDPEREILTYRHVLMPHAWGTATCYGSVLDRAADRYWLFLEHVPGRELYQVGEIAGWQQVARWLAALHASFARPAALATLPAAIHALILDRDHYARWPRRAVTFARRTSAPHSRRVRVGIEWLAARAPRLIEYLLELPATLLHGDFYASNILIQTIEGHLRVCPIDWEMTAIGPGLIDLAALTAGKWSERDRTAIALAYYSALSTSSDRARPSPAEFLRGLDYCRLYLAWQWLGWSTAWSAPPEHAQDWLGQALALAEKLGLEAGPARCRRQ